MSARTFRSVAIALAALAASAAVAHADPFDPARVPADAKYVLHVDMDALRPTQLWHVLDDQLVGNEQAGALIGKLELGLGMKFPRDVHDITVYGHDVGEANAVTVLHAKMNRGQFTAALGTLPNAGTDPYGKYDLLSFDDEQGRSVVAAFHDDGTLLFTQSPELMKAALDVLDGKAEHAGPTSPLVSGATAGASTRPTGKPLVYVAVADPATLIKGGGPPLAKEVAGGSAIVTERPVSTTRPVDGPADAEAAVHLSVAAKTADAARQLQNAAAGVRVLVMGAASGNAANPGLALAASALRTLTVTQTGNTIDGDMTVNEGRVAKAIDQAAAKAKAADADK